MTLKVDLGNGLSLRNPVLTASGTFGYGREFEDFVDFGRLGGYIVKGTTLNPREGNDYPRMAETPSGMLNAVGLQNKGVDYFVEKIYPEIRKYPSRMIVNISGSSIEDYVAVAERLAPLEDVAAVEVNISCPNVKQGGMSWGTTTDGAESVTKAVRAAFPRHLMVKLTPNVTSIAEIAKAAEGGGADSVSLINTLMGMAVDVKRRRAKLSTITGGLSGPAVRPVAVRMVWQTAKAVNIPVVGLGGITNAEDALEFILAGATAVQIGTANFLDPTVTMKTVEGLESYLRDNKIEDINELIGVI